MPAAAAHAACRGGPSAVRCRPHTISQHCSHDGVQDRDSSKLCSADIVLSQAFSVPHGHQSVYTHAVKISGCDFQRIRVSQVHSNRLLHNWWGLKALTSLEPCACVCGFASLCVLFRFLCNMCSDVCSAVLLLATACSAAEGEACGKVKCSMSL